MIKQLQMTDATTPTQVASLLNKRRGWLCNVRALHYKGKLLFERNAVSDEFHSVGQVQFTPPQERLPWDE